MIDANSNNPHFSCKDQKMVTKEIIGTMTLIYLACNRLNQLLSCYAHFISLTENSCTLTGIGLSLPLALFLSFHSPKIRRFAHFNHARYQKNLKDNSNSRHTLLLHQDSCIWGSIENLNHQACTSPVSGITILTKPNIKSDLPPYLPAHQTPQCLSSLLRKQSLLNVGEELVFLVCLKLSIDASEAAGANRANQAKRANY
jgi:hypothetical protein